MPDPVNTETTQVTPPTAIEPTPQDANRAALYQQLYGNQEPQAQAQPLPQEPVAPAVDYKAMFEQLAAKIEGMQGAQPIAAAPVVPQGPDWFELLQTGRRTEAEARIVDKVAKEAGGNILQQAIIQAQELYRTERAIEDFNSQVRATNPDMLDVEDIIALKAEQYFRQDQAKIKSPSDHIAVYKDSVGKAVTDIRNRLQRTRAVARNEAMTTRREVLSASTMTPNMIQSVREQSPQGAEVPDTSTQTYMEMRKQANGQRNLTPDVRRALNAQG